ncbi:MAG TPA: acetoacetate--CoA ligase, partial [Ktedonobacter sp.]|nr:acetoacetate--CoA ligase [Ktedonobacter sp.]
MVTPFGHDVPLWEAGEDVKRAANITRYMQWLKREKGLNFQTRDDLWQWSVDHLEDFWASLWEYFHIQASSPYSAVLLERKMPGAKWFSGATLNYAEHVFRNATSSRPALLFRSERHAMVEVSWSELQQKVASIAQSLRAMGVQRGDRVVAYMPNIPETLMAFLACASMGATWSSCSPDFGTNSVIDRFKQIEPKVLFAVDGYQYGGKTFDRRPIIAELQQSLPTLEKTVLVPYLFADAQSAVEDLSNAVTWQELLKQPSEIVFEQVPFDHPLWVLYSSGTTGLPKAIVQGHGGILLEHLKSLTLDMDLKPQDRFFWFTTTGWMM